MLGSKCGECPFLLYSITIRAAIGTKNKDQEALVMLLKGSAAAAAGFDIGDLFPSVKILPTIMGQKSKLEKIRREVDRILDAIVNEHKARRES
ncbi:hypothetical protein Vadar_013531 [Vaccinium darrowii]|uniref:Uncharacterized protein n=1 Tax=Vaccinium darrowii TaxID=229202 RepID=A0ACB7XRG9_9ERIC|nr:hypothetical protein Vadar_013531 [Vaccinium darrowii]